MEMVTIKAGGEVSIVKGDDSFAMIKAGVGGGMFERIEFTGDIDLWCDEEFLLKGVYNPNFAATVLLYKFSEAYRYEGTILQGDVIISGGCDREGNTLGLSLENMCGLLLFLNAAEALG